jgi:hypothetical protein
MTGKQAFQGADVVWAAKVGNYVGFDASGRLEGPGALIQVV